jgi:DNA-binding CsgD family transcriptional regulator
MSQEELQAKFLEDLSMTGEESTEKYADLYAIVNELSKSENNLKSVFDNVNGKFLAVSESFESLTGYTQEDIKKHGIGLYLRVFDLDHFFAPVIMQKWGVNVIKRMETATDVNYWDFRMTLCGFKVKRKNGQLRRVMMRFIPLEMGEKGAVKVYLITGDDITHLIKSNNYWGRICYGKDSKYMFTYESKVKKTQNKDILSEREIEVLKLIGEGMESKEIGAQLFTSPHTVDNHRRNAIARTGAKDTTALIQICRMCGIL